MSNLDDNDRGELRAAFSQFTRDFGESHGLAWANRLTPAQCMALAAAVRAAGRSPGTGDAVDYVRRAASRGGLTQALKDDLGDDPRAWEYEEDFTIGGEEYCIGFIQGAAEHAEQF